MRIDTTTIARTDVRDALRHLSRDRTPGRTPLTRLQVVERAVARSGMRPSPGAREYELAQLLAETVEAELERLRRTLRPRPQVDASDFRAALQRDFGVGHRELESWSAVYHLYLRPDLNIGLDEMEELLGDRHRRTLQRRLQEGVTALSVHLQTLERSAVAEARRERLAMNLPHGGQSELVGRAREIAVVRALLSADLGRRAVALGGPSGIGKTAVARAAALAEIKDDNVADVIWVSPLAEDDRDLACGEDGPPMPVQRQTSGRVRSIDAVGRLVRHAHLADHADGRPQAAVAENRSAFATPMLVVIDGVNDPAAAAAWSEEIAGWGLRARALLTGRVCWSGVDGVRPVTLRPLGRSASVALLRRLAKERGLPDVARSSDDVLDPLAEATAGVPRAIQMAVGRLRALGCAQVANELARGNGPVADMSRDMWDDGWRRASERARLVVREVATGVADGLAPTTDAVRRGAGLDHDDAMAALQEAVDLGLLEAAGDAATRSFRTRPFLRRFLATTHGRTPVD
jgi:hypothetical protein